MKEKIDELLSDFKGRLKNPLILTFIIVWLYNHWDLVYWILTVDNKISVYIRTEKILSYIEKENFYGMILCPLIMSFLSLIMYYLIANSAQFIQVWVGKRLNAAMLVRSDKGKFVEREILNKANNRIKELNYQITKLSAEINLIKEEKEGKERYLELIQDEKNKVDVELLKIKKNIEYNITLKQDIIKPLVFLLGKVNEVNVNGITTNLLKKDYSVLQGSWDIYDYQNISNDIYSLISINIEEKEVSYFNEREYGVLTGIELDYATSIVNFKILRQEKTMQVSESYHVIQINKDEFIGIMNNSYITIKRRKAA